MSDQILQVRGFKIADPLQKLQKKFGFESTYIPFELYDGYRTPAERAGDFNKLELEDFLITVAMNSRIGANAAGSFWHGIKKSEPWYAECIGLLSQLPRELELADATDQQLALICRLFDALCEVNGIKTAVAGKILCRKRPRSVPMLDSVVLPRLCQFAMEGEGITDFGSLRGSEWEDARRALDFLREVCRDGREQLHELCDSFRIQPGNPDLSPLRAFESLIWWEATQEPATTDPRLSNYDRIWGRHENEAED